MHAELTELAVRRDLIKPSLVHDPKTNVSFFGLQPRREPYTAGDRRITMQARLELSDVHSRVAAIKFLTAFSLLGRRIG